MILYNKNKIYVYNFLKETIKLESLKSRKKVKLKTKRSGQCKNLRKITLCNYNMSIKYYKMLHF